MKERKIKRISIRINENDYLYLKRHYLTIKYLYPNRHKSFSAYIRYLLDLGLDDYY